MTVAMFNGINAVIEIIMSMIQFLVFASVVVSWVGADPNNQIVRMIRDLTEPMYRPLRKLTSKLPGPIDWAPMAVLLILVFLQKGILPYIRMQVISSLDSGFR